MSNTTEPIVEAPTAVRIRAQARGMVRSCPKDDDVDFVIDLIADVFTPRQARAVARLYVASVVNDERRALTLATERAAQQVAQEARHQQSEAYRQTPAYKVEQEKAIEERAAIDQRFFAEMESHLNRYVATCRIEWTKELLAAGFTLPDGTRTTWGEATIDQHQERQAMFTANVVANAEGAARHAAAIDALRESGALCLNAFAKTSAGRLAS